MLKQLYTGIVISVLFIFIPVAIYAAGLGFDPDQTDVQPDDTFTVDVTVDPGTEQIAGSDIYILFDETYLEVQTVTAGSYFPLVNNVPSSGSLYVSGVVANPGDYKTGIGTVAQVTFKALAEGTTTLTFDCDVSQTDTSKVVQNDINATNIIDCAANEDHTVVISTSAPDNSMTTTTQTQLPQSGTYDDMLRYASIGGILLLAGALIKVALRVI